VAILMASKVTKPFLELR